MVQALGRAVLGGLETGLEQKVLASFAGEAVSLTHFTLNPRETNDRASFLSCRVVLWPEPSFLTTKW